MAHRKANRTAGTHQQWKTDALNQVLAIILLGILFFTGYLVGLIEYKHLKKHEKSNN